MQALLKRWTHALLEWLGVTSSSSDALDRWVAFALVLLAALLFDLFLQLLVVRGIRRLVERTRVKWDDKLFSVSVLNRSCHVLIAILLTAVLPVIFDEQSVGREVVLRLMQTFIVFTFLRLINALLCAAFHIVSLRPDWQNKPIKGLRQTAQGFFSIVAVILIVAILVDKSPVKLLTGLGASAAVLMLVFRDSIMGFVSGIQLSANNMLQVGDWISVPKYGADGTVEEVSLTTVKIRNWDNTLVMLPPYLLTTDSFTNWHAMQLSGGRRVMRSVSIDMTSVHFCTPEMLARFRRIDLLRDYIDRTEQRVEAYNAAHGIAPGERKINGLHQTNLGVFRAYLVRYLEEEVPVNKSMTLMVRQLQPTETGIPIQLYFFTDTVVWVDYEGIQSDVFDHVLAVIPEFGLRVFQNPAGSDVAALGDFMQGDAADAESEQPVDNASGIESSAAGSSRDVSSPSASTSPFSAEPFSAEPSSVAASEASGSPSAASASSSVSASSPTAGPKGPASTEPE
ncbi:mechanosensitive ion channel family protein [Alistipes sp.]|uniref:mechanosensitive ion channel family protein n=1 Tax=Alistipes sp. TaxID=1872444 RepID=UPI003A87912A